MATQAQTSVPAMRGVFPPFNAETFASQIIWLVIGFVILYAVMSRVALPRVASIIQKRREHIANDLAEAERARAESEAAIASYEKALADARARAQAIANDTRERYAAETEANRKALEQRLNAQLAQAEKEIAATKISAMSNVQSIATDAASAIVQQLTGAAPSAEAAAEAVKAVLKA